jgi:NitT/TauT family transport system permease protein
MRPAVKIDLSLWALPSYTLNSLVRGLLAYLLSLGFTLAYGYWAAKDRLAEKILIPLLDILQSIPVLGFMPGLVLALVSLFPRSNLGLELAAILMIFTGQVWNMTFSFYTSLKSVPPELVAVARLSKMSWWQHFLRLDLSFAATGLVWNSMMSMAGGWFFLTVSEAFVLGEQDFRLPGLGSYMSLAIERGDAKAQALGVLAMLIMIVVVDQLAWRPIVAWSQKFTDEETGSASQSWLWERIRRSRLWVLLSQMGGSLWKRSRRQTARRTGWIRSHEPSRSMRRIAMTVGAGCVLYGLALYVHLLTTLSLADWLHLLASTGITLLRVLLAVAVASIWTVPVGVAIGRNPRWARALQPVIQMAASFPAPMIFPVVVGSLMGLGAGLGLSSIVLLMLGTQWYILFNVIAGSGAIPRELWEVSRLGRFSTWRRWWTLILPGIFPHLLTGWITATGGAWNASIVAEYMKYRGQTLSTTGLGAMISQATEQGNFHILAAAVGVMAVTVVSFNRLAWRPLIRRAETRFALTT